MATAWARLLQLRTISLADEAGVASGPSADIPGDGRIAIAAASPRIAVPLVGGMISSTLLTLIVIPAIYALVKGRQLVEQ